MPNPTWRERVQTWRNIGRVPLADYQMWQNKSTCPAAEAVWNVTGDLSVWNYTKFDIAWNIGDEFGVRMGRGQWDLCDDLLDKIEDAVMEVKRNGTDTGS